MKISKLTQMFKIRGQGMSEYLIIVALIAVAAIAVTGLFGGAARNQISGLAAEISGGNASTAITQSSADATAALTESASTRGLGTYSGANLRATTN